MFQRVRQHTATSSELDNTRVEIIKDNTAATNEVKDIQNNKSRSQIRVRQKSVRGKYGAAAQIPSQHSLKPEY